MLVTELVWVLRFLIQKKLSKIVWENDMKNSDWYVPLSRLLFTVYSLFKL